MGNVLAWYSSTDDRAPRCYRLPNDCGDMLTCSGGEPVFDGEEPLISSSEARQILRNVIAEESTLWTGDVRAAVFLAFDEITVRYEAAMADLTPTPTTPTVAT